MKLTVASGSHFLVDFACAFFLFRTMPDFPRWAAVLLVYNFCAFALQMPLGLMADRWNRNFLLAAGGCLCAACGYLPLPGMASVLLLGVGNAAFHVGGGLEVLTDFSGRCAPLGIFVSPGALGLYMGTILGKESLVPLLLPAGLLMVSALCLLMTQKAFHPDWTSQNPTAALPPAGPVLLPLLGLFFVVILRSTVGMGLTLDWKSGGWSFAVVCALALGKAAGGVLADRFGLLPTAAGTLSGAAVLFALSDHPLCGLFAVFLFNMTMPLTLYASARILPGARGFAFGLLTFALFLGVLPVYWGVCTLNGFGAAVLAAGSILLMAPGLRKAGRA